MATPIRTMRDLLAAQLRALGVDRLFVGGDHGLGEIPGMESVPIGDPALASLLADSAGRISLRGGAGAALLPGGVLRLSSAPGQVAEPVTIGEPDDLASTLAAWSIGVVHTSVELVVDLDLDADAPPVAKAFTLGTEPGGARAMTLDPSLADMGILVLAGPGVVRCGPSAVDALHGFARTTGAGVLNTWGAKGLYRWDDPHHHGTVGLQALDFALGGVHDGRLVVVTGIDPLEAPEELWQSGRVIEVAPEQLELLAIRWPEPDPESPPEPPPPPQLYAQLREALAPLYASDAIPLTPAKAAADLNTVRPDGTLVVADPGPAGLWVARTLPTTELGSVVVPATNVTGFAAAAALVAALDGRRAIAIVTAPLDPVTEAMLDVAGRFGAGIVLEVWGADAAIADVGARRAALLGALRHPEGIHVLDVPVDFAHTRTLVEVAGEVIAWRGPR